MFHHHKWLLPSLCSIVLFLGAFTFFLLTDSLHANVFYKSQEGNSYKLTTVTLPQTFDKKIYEHSTDLLANKKFDTTFKAQTNYLGTIDIPFDAHNRSIKGKLIFRIKEANAKQWYAQNTYDSSQFQTDIPFPFGFPSITDSKNKLYTLELESPTGKSENVLSLNKTNPTFFTEYKFSKSAIKHPSELMDFAASKIYEEITHITSTRLLILSATIALPFFFYFVFPQIVRLFYYTFSNKPSSWERLLIILLTIIIANLLATSIGEIFYLYPREYRDGSGIDMANQFSHESNPYTLQNALPHTYIYGFVGPLINAIFSWLFASNPVITQHIITFVCMILLCIIVGKEIWESTKKVTLVQLSVIVVMLFNTVSFRMEGLAILLSIYTLSIVNRTANNKTHLSNRQLALISLSTIVLFYIKQYFLILFPVLIIFFIYNQSKKTLAYYIGMCIVICAISIPLVNTLLPVYFSNAFFNYISVAGGSIWTDWMIRQSVLFFQLNWVIVILFIAAFFIGFIKNTDIHFNITNINKPFFTVTDTPLDNVYFIYSFLAILVLTFKLGNSGAAFLSYYTQLLPIPIAIFGITYLYKRFKKYRFYQALFIGIVILFVIENYTLISIPDVVHAQDRLAWSKAIEIVETYNPKNEYLSPPFTLEAIKRDWPVSDNGHTEYFGLNAFGYPLPPGPDSYLAPRLNQWESEINYKITHKKFSLFVQPWNGQRQINTSLLAQYYVLKYSINIPIPDVGTVNFWVPKQ